MLRSFLQFEVAFLTFGSAVFLLRSNLGLGSEAIARLSTTEWNYKKSVMASLAAQNADTRVGLAMLLGAFVMQLGNAMWPLISGAGVALSVFVFAFVMWEGSRRAERAKARLIRDAEAHLRSLGVAE